MEFDPVRNAETENVLNDLYRYRMLSINPLNHVFPFPLSTAELGDYVSNRECCEECSVRIPLFMIIP